MTITASPVGPLRSRLPSRVPALAVSIEMSSPSAVWSTRIQSLEGRGTQARAMGGPSNWTIWCGGAEPCSTRPNCSSVWAGCTAASLSAAAAGSAT